MLCMQGLYIGLGLIAVGAGAIKPCVSAFLGDQFQAQDPRLQGALPRTLDIPAAQTSSAPSGCLKRSHLAWCQTPLSCRAGTASQMLTLPCKRHSAHSEPGACAWCHASIVGACGADDDALPCCLA